jgi:hypothetical protein
MKQAQKNLIELDRAQNYRVARDDIDPRGWTVVGCDGEIGKVRTLLVDIDRLRAQYLVCDVDAQRAVLLPTAYARLDKPAARVIFDVIDKNTCEKLPPYVGAPPTEEERSTIAAAMTSGISSTTTLSADRRQLDRRSV